MALDWKLDSEQSKTVELRKNGAVSAGAGSGKTRTLAARFVALVENGDADVENILTLTFTKKAAAEMYERIHRGLVESGSERARRALENFSDSTISTIDSFCAKLVRPDAGRFGYSPSFSTDETLTHDVAERTALAFVLERREDPAVAAILASLGFEAAWRELFADASLEAHSPAPGYRFDPDDAWNRQRDGLARMLAVHARAADAARREALDADSSGPTAPRGKNSPGALAAFRALPDDLESLDADELTRVLEPLAGIDLRGFSKNATDKAIQEATGKARETARKLPAIAESAAFLETARGAYAAIAECAERVADAKRAADVMTFRDAMLCAIDLLASDPKTREYWAGRYRYVMIDEFQDDNARQKDLLYLLAGKPGLPPGIPRPEELEPDKLFFVGDEKQSIYRFRGADVAVFRGLSAELGGDTPSLSTNYRSEPALVDFFNGTFARVFGAASADYEARFEAIRARAGTTPGVAPSVSLLVRERSGDAAYDAIVLADEVARRIRDDVVGGSLPVPDGTGASRPARYSDYAILLRSTANQHLVERALRKHAVPYVPTEVAGVYLDSPMNDLWAALSTAVLPGDQIAYAAFLRSPFAGLSDEGFTLALAGGGAARPFDDAVEAGLPEADRARFANARRINAWIRAAADKTPIADLVLRLWEAEGLRLAILGKPDAHPYLEHFEYVFKLASDDDARGFTLAAFVDSIRGRLGTTDRLRDLDPPREDASGVRVMTVHKAKGLEFPVVVVPFAENVGQANKLEGAWYDSPRYGLTLNMKPVDRPGAGASNVFYAEAKALDTAMQEAETKRLFYVACTRAIAHLRFACVIPDKDDTRKSFLALLAGAAHPDATGNFPDLHPMVGVETARPGPAPAPARRLNAKEALAAYARIAPFDRGYLPRELPATSLNAAWFESRRETAIRSPLPPSAYDPLAGTLPESVFGELCHAVIERRLGGDADPERFLEGLDSADAAAIRLEAERLATGFFGSEAGKAALASESARTEHPFLLRAGGVTVNGRIDLLYESDGVSYIIDFKSDKARIEGEYDLQLALYRKAISAVTGGKVESSLFWLRSAMTEPRTADFTDDDMRMWAEAAGAIRSDAPTR